MCHRRNMPVSAMAFFSPTPNWHSTLESQGIEHVQGVILDRILSTSQQSQVLGQQQPRRRQVQLAHSRPSNCLGSRGAMDRAMDRLQQSVKPPYRSGHGVYIAND